MVKSKSFIYKSRFDGFPKETDLELVEEDLPPIQNGEFLAEAVYLSVDPYMRASAQHLPLGKPYIGSQVAKVLESKNPKYPVGIYIVGAFGWRTHTISDGTTLAGTPIFKIPKYDGLPLSLALGVLGMPGNSAYFGFLELCKPKVGETVVVTGAAGAVGSIVGQIAKIKGCTVVGIAGSDEKGRWLTKDLKFDHFINYRDEKFNEKLIDATPNGVDCYFDNIGGEISSTIISRMNQYGRVSVCGAISTYNDKEPVKVSPLQEYIVGKQLKIEGFIAHRWLDRWNEGILANKQWIKEGKLKYEETVTEGFENMFKGFLEMLRGVNVGKAIHELMLKDGPRNKAYRTAIFDNRSKFQGKTVLDVGAGTGILSIFCAQAGAAKVYAVEASGIYKVAEEIVKENRFEGKIQIINSKIEDVTLPEKVDIIVSEWMGFYLLHEGMLDSVIFARDKFLKPGGLLFPESATIYSAPCSVPEMFEDWNDVEGISMQFVGKKLREETSNKPRTAVVSPDDLLADSNVVVWLDLREVTLDEVRTIKFSDVAVANKSGKYQGICLWFTCTFPSVLTEPVILSTAPEDPVTHWKQITIVLPTEVEVEEGVPIAYELSLTRSSENVRRYDINVSMLDSEEVEHPEYCRCHMTKCILVRAVLENYERNSVLQ